MGHHAEHIAGRVEDARDVAARSVTVFGIAEGHAAIALEPVQHVVVGEIIAVMVRDGNVDRLSRLVPAREQALRVLDRQRNGAADEILACIAHQSAWKQPRLCQHLETVAHAEHGHAALRRRHDRAHDRAVRRHRPATQVIAIGKAAWQGDEIEAVGQFRVAVPDLYRIATGYVAQRDPHVPVAIGTGEGDDRGLHQRTFSMR